MITGSSQGGSFGNNLVISIPAQPERPLYRSASGQFQTDSNPGPSAHILPDQTMPADGQPLDATHAEAVTVAPGEPELSEEQKKVLNRIMKGESIFFTGSAGVGKSVLTRAIIRTLREVYPIRNQVAVTATTGIAATNIGGCTLHSWAGLGLAKMSVDKLYYSLVRTKLKMDVVNRWTECKVLIIDEGK